MVVKTSGWGVADMETRRLWDLYGGEEVTMLGADAAWDEEGEADLEGEIMDDEEGDDMGYLTAEIRAIEGELATLRGHYRTCTRFLLHPDPAKRGEAGRKAAAILREADELGWTCCHLAGEYRERWREDAA